MKTDKNTVIGFILLGVLFFIFFWYNNKQQATLLEARKKQEDSLARIAASRVKPEDKTLARIESLKRDSASRIAAAGDFTTAAIGQEQLVSVENDVIKVTFTTKGGQLKSV